MILSNVNIGSGPNAGNGDKLRTAFNTINNNFAKIQSNVNGLSNTNVTSVAGRTGNIVITTQDIVGINNYATINYVTSQLANVGAANVVSLQANVIALQADVNTLYGNAGVQSATLATLTANAAAQAGELTTLTANAAAQAGNLASLLSNAAVQAGGIADLLSNAGSQHEAITSLQSNVSTLFGNAAVQAGLIANLQLSATNYGNSNVATYLTTYGGNVSVSNIIFDDLSIQTTAYTGTQWRSNLESNVRVKPSWLSYVAGGKNQEGTQYGFDTGGMFFTDNADNDFAYPIQTSLNFHEQDVLEVVATIYYSATNNDHGLCIFPAGGSPIWRSTTDSTRIAFQYSAGIPVLYGQTTSNTAPGISVLTAGNYYTVKFKYDPGNTVVVETFSGNTATGTPIDSRSLGEILPAGDYKLGFDADNDALGVKSYWTNLIVRTLTNTAVNDIEVQGQVTGNLIPSANVTYSLGNVAYQWKDLFVSNNTIYIGGIPLSIDGSGSLLVNGAPVSGGVAGNITVGNSAVNFVANSSGDGNGYSTIELRPDVNQAGTDQYLIVDPTAPGHIHIRAGGEQDNSSADLIFGGENSHVRIPAGANTAPYIKSNGYEWQFGTDGILTLAAGGSIYAAINDPIDIRVRDSGNVGYAIEQSVRDGTDTLQTLTSLDRQEFKIYTDFQNTNNVWTFAKSGQFRLAGNLRFPDTTVQTTAWTGTVVYGNTIAIGYQTGNTSQGNNAVAIGSTAGQTSQGAKAIGIGEVAGRLNQGIESIGLGAGAGEQNQGAYAIAIGSTTAYLNQGVGAVAIGTSAGALYQGEHAIAIGTGAGNGLQGNNSIILNATGSMLDQTTDDTFTVKPIRSASAGNVLYYNPASGEITYSTSNYGNAEVASYLPTYTGNIGGNIVVNGSLRVTSSNASPFTSSDALYVTGGITSGADMSAGGNITACAFTISDSINSGAIKTNGGIAAWGNLNIGGYASIGGILKVEDGVHEKFQSLADATGVVTHNCAAGHIFYHTSPDANWTANFANLNLASGYATTLTLVISQGATGYYANAVQIGGAAQTINWQGNTTPTPSSNRTDVASFSIINNSGTYTVLGQLTGF